MQYATFLRRKTGRPLCIQSLFLSLQIDLESHIFNPTGGVIKPNSTIINISIPNQIFVSSTLYPKSRSISDGKKIGTNNNITKGSCDEFCLSLGSVKKFWLTTTDELITPPPTSSPTSPPIQKLNTWAVAFLSSVVCVGFLIIAGLFCKNNVGSRST